MVKKHSLTIILLGRSGSGKDTQAVLLAQRLRCKQFITGERLRAVASEPTVVGKRLRSELKNGRLAPTWLAFFLWVRELLQLKIQERIIFNGSPRKLSEAKFLDDVLGWLGRGKPSVILIEVSSAQALKRLMKRRICSQCDAIIPYVGDFRELEKCNKCGGMLKSRPDDTPQAIKTRFSWFQKEVVPVIRYYERQGLLHRINGEQSIEDVEEDLLKVIEKASKS